MIVIYLMGMIAISKLDMTHSLLLLTRKFFDVISRWATGGSLVVPKISVCKYAMAVAADSTNFRKSETFRLVLSR